MQTEQETVRAALGRLPIFPLPNAVLLPYELLPLHVFEPRYRQMIEDVLAQGRPLAVAQLARGWEGSYEGRPAVEPICGAGIVVRHERLPDGRFNILLRGVARVAIEAELPARRLYREVQGRILDDVVPDDPAALEERVESVRRMLFALCAARPGPASSALAELAARARGPASLADIVAAALLVDFDRRHEALTTVEVGARLDIAQTAIAEMLISETPAEAPTLRN